MLRPALFRTAAVATVAILAAACGSSDRKTPRDTVATAAPVVVTPETTTVQPSAGSVVPANVSYADAESAYHARHYGDATEMFGAYVQRRPDNPWGHYMLGLSAWKAGQLERAESAFDQSLVLDPKHVKSLVNLSRVLLEENKGPDALEKIGQAIQLDSTSADAWRVLGRVHAQLGHVDDALTAYQTALTIDPQDTWSMNNMGLLLIRAGRYDDALRPLARAVQLDDGEPAFLNNLGVALERTGHYASATEQYRAALSADSSYTKAQVSLARVDGRGDEEGIAPVDLGSLGDEFAKQIDDWRAVAVAGTARVDGTMPDSGTVPPR